MTSSIAWLSILFVLIVAGESAHVRLAPRRGISPIASAAAVAFMLSLPTPVGVNPAVVLVVGMVVVTFGTLLGAGIATLAGLSTTPIDIAGRLMNAFVAGLLGLILSHGGLEHEVTAAGQRWIYALALWIVALTAAGFRFAVVSALAARADRRSFVVTFKDEVYTFGLLSLAASTTAVMIVLSQSAIGLWGPLFFMLPLALSWAAARRYAHTRRTYRESIAALSRLTDLAGYTTPDHGRRVAELSVALARLSGLSQREIDTVERAALLHDLGQVALDEPIPGGATVLAAPRDQERIANDGVAIIRHSGVLDDAALVLASQATPFRSMLEDDERIPLEARIIKLANAFEDLTAGSREQSAVAMAIERIHLGLGYEYDPVLVNHLIRVVGHRHLGHLRAHSQRPARSSRAGR